MFILAISNSSRLIVPFNKSNLNLIWINLHFVNENIPFATKMHNLNEFSTIRMWFPIFKKRGFLLFAAQGTFCVNDLSILERRFSFQIKYSLEINRELTRCTTIFPLLIIWNIPRLCLLRDLSSKILTSFMLSFGN